MFCRDPTGAPIPASWTEPDEDVQSTEKKKHNCDIKSPDGHGTGVAHRDAPVKKCKHKRLNTNTSVFSILQLVTSAAVVF